MTEHMERLRRERVLYAQKAGELRADGCHNAAEAYDEMACSLDAAIEALEQGELHIVFDGPPGPEAGRFVEVETPDGKSVCAGRWEQRDKYWHLVLPSRGQLQSRVAALEGALWDFIQASEHAYEAVAAGGKAGTFDLVFDTHGNIIDEVRAALTEQEPDHAAD